MHIFFLTSYKCARIHTYTSLSHVPYYLILRFHHISRESTSDYTMTILEYWNTKITTPPSLLSVFLSLIQNENVGSQTRTYVGPSIVAKEAWPSISLTPPLLRPHMDCAGPIGTMHCILGNKSKFQPPLFILSLEFFYEFYHYL